MFKLICRFGFKDRELIFLKSETKDHLLSFSVIDDVFFVDDIVQLNSYHLPEKDKDFITSELGRGSSLLVKTLEDKLTVISYLFYVEAKRLPITELDLLLDSDANYVYGANTIEEYRGRGAFKDNLRFLREKISGAIYIAVDKNNSSSISSINSVMFFKKIFSLKVSSFWFFKKVELKLLK
ncbi:hypothetical protein [Vibrio alginolyticus]|uniref:hypothetical protein n=1 Tax=Vibrio alginolyticus TaxID=663 RepID=UPI001BD5B6E2|nr:hypothetical protein [Vibrio alginolyticus]ELP3325890.1 hypothetical protein [Vibrio alginolyticus]MBS9914477.1 hypothetical protein [Vibrio alginolyticus]